MLCVLSNATVGMNAVLSCPNTKGRRGRDVLLGDFVKPVALTDIDSL